MDHYKTLGVGKNATPDEIKKAYRKLASQHHPDKGGDTATFQKIEEAYRILSDPTQRQQYDNPAPQGMHGFPGGFSFNVNGFDIGDIFGSMFNQGHNSFHSRNQVFRSMLNISLIDAYKGLSHSLKLNTPQGSKFINIEIPKGIKTGDQIRYENVIENGILIIEFNVLPDLKFERNGNDLYVNHGISVLDLIVGTKFTFTTISGKNLEVNVKPQTQPYMQLKIQGEGMPINGTSMYGDQIILLKPYMPDNIDESIIQSILNSKTQ